MPNFKKPFWIGISLGAAAVNIFCAFNAFSKGSWPVGIVTGIAALAALLLLVSLLLRPSISSADQATLNRLLTESEILAATAEDLSRKSAQDKDTHATERGAL